MMMVDRFCRESDALRSSWGYKDDEYMDYYLRTGRNRWDLHPCRVLIRRCLEEYLASASLARTPSVLEVGCGSGNEYDGLAATGLANRISYTGVDISPRNVANAKRRYPSVDFREADILDNSFGDDAFDVVFLKDVLEHLSLDACHFCLAECIRIARAVVLIAFFNEDREAVEHLIQPVREYHWNCYSRARLIEFLSGYGVTVEIMDLTADQMEEYPHRSVWRLTCLG